MFSIAAPICSKLPEFAFMRIAGGGIHIMSNEAEQAVGAETTNESTVATSATPGAAPTRQAQVDLSQIPEFRKFQSEQDRKAALERAQHQAELAAIKQQMAEVAQRMSQREESDLATLDPEEQVAALKRKLAQQAQENERQRQESDKQAKVAEMTRKLGALLQKHGLRWDDPRLVGPLSLGATPEGYEAVRDAIDDIAAEARTAAERKAEEAARQALEAASQARKKGKVEGITETGATTTSNSPGVPAVEDDDQAKRMAQHRKYFNERIRGKGYDNPDRLRFIERLRKEGLTIADVAPG